MSIPHRIVYLAACAVRIALDAALGPADPPVRVSLTTGRPTR